MGVRFQDAWVAQLQSCTQSPADAAVIQLSMALFGTARANRLFFTTMEQLAKSFVGASPVDAIDWTPDTPCPCAKRNTKTSGAINWAALLAFLEQLLPIILPLFYPRPYPPPVDP
jgi:hypothetical protein